MVDDVFVVQHKAGVKTGKGEAAGKAGEGDDKAASFVFFIVVLDEFVVLFSMSAFPVYKGGG